MRNSFEGAAQPLQARTARSRSPDAVRAAEAIAARIAAAAKAKYEEEKLSSALASENARQEAVVPEPAPVAAVPVAPFGEGSCVEIYSISCKVWCPAVIQRMDDTAVFVTYRLPGDEESVSGETVRMNGGLLRDSPDLQLRCATDNGPWKDAVVEIFISSQKSWCLGKITDFSDGIATVEYRRQGADPESEPVMTPFELGNPALQLFGAKVAYWRHILGPLGVPIAMARPSKVGQQVEVFRISRWHPGRVQEVHGSKLKVEFHEPDMQPEELANIHPYVRLTSDELSNLRAADFVQGSSSRRRSTAEGLPPLAPRTPRQLEAPVSEMLQPPQQVPQQAPQALVERLQAQVRTLEMQVECMDCELKAARSQAAEWEQRHKTAMAAIQHMQQDPDKVVPTHMVSTSEQDNDYRSTRLRFRQALREAKAQEGCLPSCAQARGGC